MLFNRALVSSLLFASAVLAVSQHRQASFLDIVEESVNGGSAAYSRNWAGALLEKTPGVIKTVTGTFVVPGTSGKYGSGAAIWVGIDGDKCQTNLLQTGIAIYPGESPEYQGWYEWFPADSMPFDGISFKEGDKVKLTVTAYSKTSGHAKIENLTTRQSAEQKVTAPAGSELCMQEAEWIVEDFGIIENGKTKPVPFAYFTPITFEDAYAKKKDGKTYGLKGASTIDLVARNNTILADAKINGKTVTVVRTW